jgi:diacylglycerol kinase
MAEEKQTKKFSLRERIKSATHAWRGIGILLRTTHNAWGHIFFGLLAVYLGFVLKISTTEWLFLVFAIGLVLITETINTSIEIDLDLTSPQPHPHARDSKDVAAAAVLLSVFTAIVVGAIIFLPKILYDII